MATFDAPEFIYKIVGQDFWEKSQGEQNLPPMPIDEADGYMHFSTASQLAKTLELYFAGQAGVVILAVEVARLPEALKWEASRGGDLFPHLYANLPMSAISRVERIDVPVDGPCELPASITGNAQ